MMMIICTLPVYRSKLESTVQQEQQKKTSLESQLDDSKRKEKELHSNVESAKKDGEDRKRQLGQKNCSLVFAGSVSIMELCFTPLWYNY